jgi:hypothetical protein
MRKEQKCIFGESDDEGALTELEFIFSKQVRFKTYMYRVAENSRAIRIYN